MRHFMHSGFAFAAGVSTMLAIGSSSACGQNVAGFWGDADVSPIPSAQQFDYRAQSRQPQPTARPTYSQQSSETPVTNQGRQVIDFYGGNAAVATLSKMPRRPQLQQTAAQPEAPRSKPFQGASNGPTVSPYLNLFRDENENREAVPSYFTFVRPQLEQQETSQRQQRQIQTLERQLARRPGPAAAAAAPPQPQAASPRNSGVSARYMDTAQYYSGWQR